jgi:hypothetical protein
MKSSGSPYVDKDTLRAFLKTICIESCRIAQSEQKSAKNIDRVVNRTLSCKRTPVSTGAVKHFQA